MFKTIVDKELTVAVTELNVSTADSSLFHAVSLLFFPLFGLDLQVMTLPQLVKKMKRW